MTDTTKQVIIIGAGVILAAMFAWITQLTTRDEVTAMIEHRPGKVTQDMLKEVNAELDELHDEYHSLDTAFKVYAAEHRSK